LGLKSTSNTESPLGKTLPARRTRRRKNLRQTPRRERGRRNSPHTSLIQENRTGTEEKPAAWGEHPSPKRWIGGGPDSSKDLKRTKEEDAERFQPLQGLYATCAGNLFLKQEARPFLGKKGKSCERKRLKRKAGNEHLIEEDLDISFASKKRTACG